MIIVIADKSVDYFLTGCLVFTMSENWVTEEVERNQKMFTVKKLCDIILTFDEIYK